MKGKLSHQAIGKNQFSVYQDASISKIGLVN